MTSFLLKNRPDLRLRYSSGARDSMPIKEETPIFTPRRGRCRYRLLNLSKLDLNFKRSFDRLANSSSLGKAFSSTNLFNPSFCLAFNSFRPSCFTISLLLPGDLYWLISFLNKKGGHTRIRPQPPHGCPSFY